MGLNKRLTDRPTSFMMTTKFVGIIVVNIGSKRRLARPLTPIQEDYLVALGISAKYFTEPTPG
jgi:hypothetical protein